MRKRNFEFFLITFVFAVALCLVSSFSFSQSVEWEESEDIQGQSEEMPLENEAPYQQEEQNPSELDMPSQEQGQEETEIEEPVKKKKKKKRKKKKRKKKSKIKIPIYSIFFGYAYVIPSGDMSEIVGNGHQARLFVRQRFKGKGSLKYFAGMRASSTVFEGEPSKPRGIESASPEAKLSQTEVDLAGGALYYFNKKMAVTCELGLGMLHSKLYILENSGELADDYTTGTAFGGFVQSAYEHSFPIAKKQSLLGRAFFTYSLGQSAESAKLKYSQKTHDLNPAQINLGLALGYGF